MGCSFSKEVKSPKGSEGTSLNKVVHRGLSIQVDRSIKTTGGGYIAAVFSANCGFVRNPAPTKALEKSGSLPSAKGSYPQHKVSAAPLRINKHLPEKIRADTVLGIPILSTNHESETQNSTTESTNENLETINIRELMEGLSEEEISANFEANHEPSMSLTQVADRRRAPPEKPTDDGVKRRVSPGKSAARRPRPKSFSSFKSIEDVDLALSARRSNMPPRDSNVDIDRLTCETNSNAADTMGSCFDDKPFRNPDNLQRALSFKYMFNDYSSKNQDFLNSGLNPAASQIDDRNARVQHGDDLVLEGEGDSASPKFSSAISLREWLPSSNHRSNPPGYLQGDLEPSILDAFQTYGSYTSEQGAPHHSSDSRKANLVNAQGVSNQSPSVQYQEGTGNLSTRVEECGAPVFDPEMLDSFENAMKQLSKEEWDAVRGMEDSPRNFLRLVKALKKSSSNCIRNQKAFADSMEGMDSKDRFEPVKPLDMKLRKLSLEKKVAFMRQNSLEVKKAVANKLIKEDQERASVVFYSTTTRRNAKIYGDCNQVRNILQSLVGVYYVERSISELLEHEQELEHVLNVSAVIVPTIYVKGKYLVGVDSIMQLYKKGLLGAMLQEAMSFGSKTSIQCICRGGKFLICPFCKGRRTLSRIGEGTLLCRYCSGTGLIKCLKCSST